MRKALMIAKREYLATVRTKGFIIGLLVAPLMMSGSGLAIWLLKDQVDITDKKVAIVDRSGVMADSLVEAAVARNAEEVLDEETGEKVKPAYLFEIVEPNEDDPEAQRLELSNQIRNKQLYAFLDIGRDVVHPGKDPAVSRIGYHAKNAALDDLRRWMGWPINNHLRKLRLADAGIEESAVKDLFYWANVESLGLASVNVQTGKVQEAQRSNEIEAIAIPAVMMILMFMMVMMGAMPLLQSVMEEKNQRIAEVMLGSIRPFEFMAGKLIGGISVSLTVSAVYVIGGISTVAYLGLQEYIPFHILPWFFTYMLLEIVMLGSVLLALGSACNDAKDAQNLTFPAMIPVLIPMFVIMPILQHPMSTFATWLSLFPPFTPLLMLLRQSAPGGVPIWQPWLGLIGVLAFTTLAVWTGGRIFRVGILMQGTPPKLGNILRWAVRG